MNRRIIHLTAILFAAGAVALGGCATSGSQGSSSQDPATTPASDPDPVGSENGRGPVTSVGRRTQSAVEGLVGDAATGAQPAPIGTEVGAGTFLIYGALTGHTPLDGRRGRGGGYGGGYGSVTSEERREAALEEQIAQEAARGEVLEDEIASELERQEELLRQIDSEEAASYIARWLPDGVEFHQH